MAKKSASIDLKKKTGRIKDVPGQGFLFESGPGVHAIHGAATAPRIPSVSPAKRKASKDTAVLIPVIDPPANPRTKKKTGEILLPVPKAAYAPSTGGNGGGNGGHAQSVLIPPLALAAAEKRPRRTAEDMAKNQREISISEFFRKNRHLLGFDNPTKALLTTVKEAVDNSLDACEEAGILPEITVDVIKHSEDRYTVRVTDNGPGIVTNQIGKIFGKLLYGSKFHSFKMSRGQQGIGISAAGMYGQMTTGKPTKVISRVLGTKGDARYCEIRINAAKNAPEPVKDETIAWDKSNGTSVEIEMEARYIRGARSVEDYLKQTAIANPHVRMVYNPPEGEERMVFERSTETLPPEPIEIKPHPHGVELGVMVEMMHASKARSLTQFFREEFSRVTPRVTQEICEKAGVPVNMKPAKIDRPDVEKIFRAIQEVKIIAPPTNCITPIGENLILDGLKKEIQADFYATTTRPPKVYRGNPFQIEAGIAYGGGLPEDGLARLLRFANRVPLLYQQSACAIYKSVLTTDWRNYHITQNKGALPGGPLVILLHVASVWVPFTSESKEAIAHYPEIIKEMKLALQECGRKLGIYLSHRRRDAEEERKRSHIELYIPHIGDALQEILGITDKDKEKTIVQLRGLLERSRIQQPGE
jgi:DNA topoisomerase-6 subunit B